MVKLATPTNKPRPVDPALIWKRHTEHDLANEKETNETPYNHELDCETRQWREDIIQYTSMPALSEDDASLSECKDGEQASSRLVSREVKHA